MFHFAPQKQLMVAKSIKKTVDNEKISKRPRNDNFLFSGTLKPFEVFWKPDLVFLANG